MSNGFHHFFVLFTSLSCVSFQLPETAMPAKAAAQLFTAAHELGHNLGMGHDDVTANSVMNTVVPADTANPIFSPQQINNFLYLAVNTRDLPPKTLHRGIGFYRISLLERARLRDALAWRQLANLYGRLVASWCRKSLTDPHTIADCVQDVFASVAVSLDSFEPTHKVGSFRAWLWTITRNKIRDHIRRNGKHPLGTGRSSMMLALNNVVDPVPNEEPTESLQLQELMERALAQVRLEFEERTWQAFWRSASAIRRLSPASDTG